MTDQAVELTNWTLSTSGWAPWIVLPIAMVAWWAIRRLYRTEANHASPTASRWMRGLRGVAVVILIFLLVEPSYTRFGEQVELPLVTIFIDDSQSMAVDDSSIPDHHRLDEAIALGLVNDERRDLSARRARSVVHSMLAGIPQFRRALRDPSYPASQLELLQDQLADHLQGIQRAQAELSGHPQLEEHFLALISLLEQTQVGLQQGESINPDHVADQLRAWQPRGRTLITALDDAQGATDASLVNVLDDQDPLRVGLREVAKLSRFERAAALVSTRLIPQLHEHADLSVRRLGDGVTELNIDQVSAADLSGLAATTDFASPLRALADETGGRNLGGVLLVSDGRLTTGGDPRPSVGVLKARGVHLGGIVVGHTNALRDAAVDRIDGPREVFLGETISIEVRYRIAGYGDASWELVLSRDGHELSRRPVVGGDGRWQTESFELSAESAGLTRIKAALQPLEQAARLAELPRGLDWDRWSNIEGSTVRSLTQSPIYKQPSQEQRILERSQMPTDSSGRDYGSRLQGWLIPPETGRYRFYISSNDDGQLWLSSDSRPEHAALIAHDPQRSKEREWDDNNDQRSHLVDLRAGEPYWIEIFHKQGKSNAHCAVGWTRPNNPRIEVIDGDYLVPASVGLEAVLNRDEQIASASKPTTHSLSSEAILDNNSAEHAVVVNEDPLRVLLLDALPRWDSRYLVSLFERDERVEITRRYRSIELGRRNLGAAVEPFLPPSQQDLDAYDVLVLGDLRPDELLPEDQARIADYVRRRGGFLIVLSGPRAMPAAYKDSRIADILPVRASGAVTPTTRDQRAQLQLTSTGQRHSITAILDDQTLNVKLWPALSPLRWTATGFQAKPGADVLVETIDNGTPIVALQRFGAGRVCYLGSDESWRWRDRLGDRVHQTFWLQVQRWGLSDRLRGADPRLQVAVDRARIAPDESAEIRARVVDTNSQPTSVQPLVLLHQLDVDDQVIDGSEQRVELSELADAHGLWQQRLEQLAPGRWRIRVTIDDPAFNDIYEDRLLLVQRPTGAETRYLDPDPVSLQRLAAAGGLRAGGMAEADAIADELIATLRPDRRALSTTTHLWNNYWALLVVVALLVSEWLIRKRNGLP